MTVSTTDAARPNASSAKACGLRPSLCVARDVGAMLRESGLRPTRQRVALGRLLFGAGDRHVTADILHDEAIRARIHVSQATVYNTLNQFTEAGLLRELAVDGARSWYDTNVGDHHHFMVAGELVDIPGDHLEVAALPAIPDGMELARVDIVLRLRPKRARS